MERALWYRLLKGAVTRAVQALRRTVPEPTTRGTAFFWPGQVAGVTVSHTSALELSSVWSCVRVIAEGLAQLPWHVMQVTRSGARERVQNTTDWLLHKQANPTMSAFQFRELLLGWTLTWGNGYAEIERDQSGRAVWLWPISPDRVNVDRDAAGNVIYDIINRGQANTVLPAADMFHLRGLGGDGRQGFSVVTFARRAIALGLATEEFGTAFFGNGSFPGGAIKHPGTLGKTGRDNLRQSWEEMHRGPKNAGRVAVFEEGVEWQQIGIPPEDAQFLQTRKFQVLEICRWFRVPPHKLADLERATFSNIEHQSIEFVTDTMVPWAVRFEQEADLKLFGQNRASFYTKINMNGLLRGDQQSRNNAYATGRQWGWLSVNDIRALEDLNPLPPHIGDVYLVPLNMAAVPLRPGQPMPPIPEPSLPPPDPEDAFRAALADQATRNGTHNGELH